MLKLELPNKDPINIVRATVQKLSIGSIVRAPSSKTYLLFGRLLGVLKMRIHIGTILEFRNHEGCPKYHRKTYTGAMLSGPGLQYVARQSWRALGLANIIM